MKIYWIYLNSSPHGPERLQVMVDREIKRGERVTLRDTLGHIERVKDGSWVCYVKTYPLYGTGYIKYVGYEPSASLAKDRVYGRYMEEKIAKESKKSNSGQNIFMDLR